MIEKILGNCANIILSPRINLILLFLRRRIRKSTMPCILFLAANPTNNLRLDKEQREIQAELRRSNLREEFDFQARVAVRPGDFTQALLDVKPNIVHFSGHGAKTGEICIENDAGRIMPISPKTLSKLFELVSDHVDCVLLNACYSKIQAEAINKHIKFVIGMTKEIGDEAAIIFSKGFYKAIGAGKTIEQAYKFGLVELEMLQIDEFQTPILLIKDEDTISIISDEAPKKGIITKDGNALIAILINNQLINFTSKQKDTILFDISKTLNIELNQIQVLRVMEGSVKLIIQLPKIAARKLVLLCELGYQKLVELKITSISSINEVDFINSQPVNNSESISTKINLVRNFLRVRDYQKAKELLIEAHKLILLTVDYPYLEAFNDLFERVKGEMNLSTAANVEPMATDSYAENHNPADIHKDEYDRSSE